jgi:predicted ester cyclase
MTPLDDRTAREFLARLHGAVNAHDAGALAALCAEDVVWKDPAALEPLHGRDAVYRFHRDTMFRSIPDVRVELIDGPYLAPDGSRVAVRLRISGTMLGPMIPPGFAPTGAPLQFETAEFSELEGGLLARHRVMLDMLALARQIGAAPRVGSAADRANVWFQRFAAWRAQRSRRPFETRGRVATPAPSSTRRSMMPTDDTVSTRQPSTPSARSSS